MYVGNGLSMWESVKYVGNNVDLQEMAQICLEMA